MKIIIDKNSKQVVGKTTDDNYIVSDVNHEIIDAPINHKFEDEISDLFWNGEELILDTNNNDAILDIKIRLEKQWRDSELERTDKFATIKDMPYYYAHISYRQALRDYPSTEDFPNGERPVLDKTIKNALTKYQFMSRFTPAERIAIQMGATQSAELADWVELFKLTEEVNLNDQATILGVNMLETAGILAEGRSNEILE
jgi:hypothetical protein